jgi:hypothetical protein
MLEATVACIDRGRIIYLLGKVCSKDMVDIAVLYLKLREIMNSRFGTLVRSFGMMRSHNNINVRAKVLTGVSETC